jgi:hypothetical protein
MRSRKQVFSEKVVLTYQTSGRGREKNTDGRAKLCIILYYYVTKILSGHQLYRIVWMEFHQYYYLKNAIMLTILGVGSVWVKLQFYNQRAAGLDLILLDKFTYQKTGTAN